MVWANARHALRARKRTTKNPKGAQNGALGVILGAFWRKVSFSKTYVLLSKNLLFESLRVGNAVFDAQKDKKSTTKT